MGWPGRNQDPFDARSKALSDQIRRLEREIRQLSDKPPVPSQSSPAKARSRPETQPLPQASPPQPPSRTKRPIANPIPAATVATPPPGKDARINPHGIRKFDLAAVWNRFLSSFKGPAPSNPRMVHYLAAGSVHGLRPLRYEKRVARNRFIGLFLLLVLILFGLARVYFP